MAFNFDDYQSAFNSGDDERALEFWDDELQVTLPVSPTQIAKVANNKEEFRQFLTAAHDGIREIMRLQTFLQKDEQIFAEFDMDFIALEDRPEFPFGPLKKDEFVTVKMFGVYTLRNDKLWVMNMAFWPANQGVTDPPSFKVGQTPPDFGHITRAAVG